MRLIALAWVLSPGYFEGNPSVQQTRPTLRSANRRAGELHRLLQPPPEVAEPRTALRLELAAPRNAIASRNSHQSEIEA